MVNTPNLKESISFTDNLQLKRFQYMVALPCRPTPQASGGRDCKPTKLLYIVILRCYGLSLNLSHPYCSKIDTTKDAKSHSVPGLCHVWDETVSSSHFLLGEILSIHVFADLLKKNNFCTTPPPPPPPPPPQQQQQQQQQQQTYLYRSLLMKKS